MHVTYHHMIVMTRSDGTIRFQAFEHTDVNLFLYGTSGLEYMFHSLINRGELITAYCELIPAFTDHVRISRKGTEVETIPIEFII